MNISKKISFIAGSLILFVGLVAGFALNAYNNPAASAQTACMVDGATLAKLYDAVFHRPLDAGADFHLNKPLDTVLDTLAASQEHRQYTGVFTAVKALEEARRAPGTISETDKGQYKKLIDSALSTVDAWADTLPQQAIENRVIGPDQARAAIQRAYDSMNPTAKAAAEYGLFNALERIGAPSALPIPSLPPQANPGQ